MSDDGRYRVEGELRYNVRLNELHGRFYSRVRLAINFLSIASGTAVFVAFTDDLPTLGKWVGGLIVLLSIADQVCDYGGLASQRADARKAYCELVARQALTGVDELKSAMADIDARFYDMHDIESLREVARNDVLRERGDESDRVVETWRQRFMRAIA